MNLIDYFDRVYIVNLPERSDRRREMETELQRIGLSVDGQKIRYFRAIRPESAGSFPSIGSLGCFMSHLEILREAERDQLNNVLIMEDDLSISASLAEPQPEMFARLKSGDWDFAYLGHVEETPSVDSNPIWCDSKIPMATTHFYGLNHSAISVLKSYLEACLKRSPGDPEGGPMHVDGAYSLFRMKHPSVKTLMAVPSLGGQRSSRSDIYPNKWYDRIPVGQQLAGFARSIKNLLGRIFNSDKT